MGDHIDVLGEFTRTLVPRAWLEAAELLVSLDFPIPDRKSLVMQLAKRRNGGNGRNKVKQDNAMPSPCLDMTAELVERVFAAEDFGIDTPQSGVEKFIARIGSSRLTGSGRDALDFSRPIDVNDLPSEPGQPVLDVDWGDDPCGRAAEQAWLDFLASPYAHTIGPTRAHQTALILKRERCRSAVNSPGFIGRGVGLAERMFARCYFSSSDPIPTHECTRQVDALLDTLRRSAHRDRGILDGAGIDLDGP